MAARGRRRTPCRQWMGRRESIILGRESRRRRTTLPRRGQSRRQHRSPSFTLHGLLKRSKGRRTRSQTDSAVRAILCIAASRSGTSPHLTTNLSSYRLFPCHFQAQVHGHRGLPCTQRKHDAEAFTSRRDAGHSYTRTGRPERGMGRGTPKGKRRSSSSRSIRCTSSMGACRSSLRADADGTVWAARSVGILLGTSISPVRRRHRREPSRNLNSSNGNKDGHLAPPPPVHLRLLAALREVSIMCTPSFATPSLPPPRLTSRNAAFPKCRRSYPSPLRSYP